MAETTGYFEQESCNRQEGLYQLRKYQDICIIQIYLCYLQFYKVKTSVTTAPSSLQVSVDTLWDILMVSLISSHPLGTIL